MDKKQSKSYYAAVVVINSLGQVLLGKRKEDGIWTTPAGGAEPGEENPSKTAVRELFEEAAIAADPRFLQPLGAVETRNGKLCHTFLYIVSSGVMTTSKLDPDEEVNKWKWFSMDEIPNALRDDPRRFETVRNGFMKFHGIEKSLIEQLEKGGKPAVVGETRNFGGKQYQKMGDGSWKPVVLQEEKQLEAEQNKNKVVSLKDKLQSKIEEKRQISQAQKHLEDLKNQTVVEGKQTRSERPMFTNVEAAMAHGYDAQDFREVGNFFYDRARQMADNIAKLEATGQKPEPALEKIRTMNLKMSKQFIGQANRIDDRQKVKKSTVMMGHADAAEINTADYSVERKNSEESQWLDRLQAAMEGYQYGDTPRVVPMDKGDLYLVKVDDGMYSGLFKIIGDDMIDNAKVRIERMTLPSIVQFCMAKEYIDGIKDQPPVVQHGMNYAADMDHMGGQIAQQEKQSELNVLRNFVAQKLSHTDSCQGCEVCQPAPSFRDLDVIQAKIRMLELVNKLLS